MFLLSRNKTPSSPEPKAQRKRKIIEDDSSSDSDIENYLQPMDKIDLRSPFFDIKVSHTARNNDTEQSTANVQASSSTSADEEASTALQSPFQKIQEFAKTMEEAKRQVEAYKAKKQTENEQADPLNLLQNLERQASLDVIPPTDDSDSDKEAWEEVENEAKEPSSLPKEDLQITVDMPGCVKKKKGTELLASIKRRINNMRKATQLLIHKVHLLCWLAHGLQVNAAVSSEKILAMALSVIPTKYTASRTNQNNLEQLLQWFTNSVANVNRTIPKILTLRTLLGVQIVNMQAYNVKMLVYIFAAILRALGVQCRLVFSLRVEPLKPPRSELHSLSAKNSEAEKEKRESDDDEKVKRTKNGEAEKVKRTRSKSFGEIPQKNFRNKKDAEVPKRTYSLRSHKDAAGEDDAKVAIPRRSMRRVRFSTPSSVPQLDGVNDSDTDDEVFIRRTSQRLKKQNPTRTPFSPKNNSQRTSVGSKNKRTPEDRSSKPEKRSKRSDPDEATDVWIEVFLESDKKWVSVDVVGGQIDCVADINAKATQPISYVIAYNNNHSVKEVTRRYCQNFSTKKFRELRVKPKWWEAALKPFSAKPTAQDKREDEELERQHLDQPLPTTITEYKDHPLYVLQRHLLKYEAIYPADAPTLGFVRSEPVYSRQCVHVLHPRDIWYKQHAKVVKPGETAYKIVKGRPRWDKLSSQIVTDPTEEVFGSWQVQDYDPPTAEGGVVPRNAYGNVELFRPAMLPKKTVQLRLPGLSKIARRMNIDCAPAIVGFEYTGGWLHPSYDGFVVCEEFADILVAAWELDQDEMEKREQEKLEKRVYGNWKKLIKGLRIQERLKLKYEFGESPKKRKTEN